MGLLKMADQLVVQLLWCLEFENSDAVNFLEMFDQGKESLGTL